MSLRFFRTIRVVLLLVLAVVPRGGAFAGPPAAPPLDFVGTAYTYDDNVVWLGTALTPADPDGAAGPTHFVCTGQSILRVFDSSKQLVQDFGLSTFFAPLAPTAIPLQPRVVYDEFAQRFVVIATETVDDVSTTSSRILIAVSKSQDPTAGWWFDALNTRLVIGGAPTFADAPGLAVDSLAVYVTTAQYEFFNGGTGASAGIRLWIVHKDSLYAGRGIVATAYDPAAQAGVVPQPIRPALVHPPAASPTGGTFLCAYSGLTDGTAEYLEVIRVIDPLGTTSGPSFLGYTLSMGDVDDALTPLPQAPQLGTTHTIYTGNREVGNAVLRGHSLYACATVVPPTGPDAGQATAHWWRVDTSGWQPVIVDQGDVGAENLGATTYTFFPSVEVDACGDMAVGFSVSSPTIYVGAAYTARLSTDVAGTTQPPAYLAQGLDWYYRTFGTMLNRWGYRSAMAIDPADPARFWIFNAVADVRGSPNGGEDGRWGVVYGRFGAGCTYTPVAIEAFDAHAEATGVVLSAEFAPWARAFEVDVYRSRNGAPTERIARLRLTPGQSLRYRDASAEPGTEWTYWIVARTADGESRSPAVRVRIPEPKTALLPNEPNPFHPDTRVRFSLARASHVTIEVFDAAGRRVRTLVDSRLPSGEHRVLWDGRDGRGRAVASGVYFCRLQAGGIRRVNKMLLVR